MSSLETLLTLIAFGCMVVGISLVIALTVDALTDFRRHR